MTFAKKVWATMSKIDLSSQYKQIPRKGTYLPWGPAWRALKENFPGSFDRYSNEVTPNGELVVTCTLTVSDGENELVHTERVKLDGKDNSLVDKEKRALVKAIARATGLAFHLCEKEEANYAQSTQKQPQKVEQDKGKCQTLARLKEQAEILGAENIPQEIAGLARSADVNRRRAAVARLDAMIEQQSGEKWTAVRS